MLCRPSTLGSVNTYFSNIDAKDGIAVFTVFISSKKALKSKPINYSS